MLKKGYISAVVVVSGRILFTGQVSAKETGETQSRSPLSLASTPTINTPLLDSSQYFFLGGGIEASLRHHVPRTVFFVQGGIEYNHSPTAFVHSLSLAGAIVGGSVRFPLGSAIKLLAHSRGGYVHVIYNDEPSVSSTSPFEAGGAGIQVVISPSFNIEAGTQYQYYAGLYQGSSIGLGTTISLGGGSSSGTALAMKLQASGSQNPKVVHRSASQKSAMEFNPNFSDAFPVFYKYYDDHPIGRLEIVNHTQAPDSNVRVHFYIRPSSERWPI